MAVPQQLVLLLFLGALLRPDEMVRVPASPSPVRIADRTLADAAAVAEDERGVVIRYNPAVLARLGPTLSSFVMAHEEAHVRLEHLRLLADAGAETRVRLELEADCEAARRLASTEPGAVRAATVAFAALGEARDDLAHPTGTARARRIRSCAGTH